MIDKMRENHFESVSYEEWKEVALKSMKGLPFDRLLTKTLEGIELQPLYTKETFEKDDKVLKAVREGIASTYWTIAQNTYAPNSKEFLTRLKESFEKGNEAIVYDARWPVAWDDTDLKEVAQLAKDVPVYAFNVKEDDKFNDIFTYISDEDRDKVKGFYLGEKALPEGYTNIRKFGIDTVDLHIQGADIITELAVTLAKAVEYQEEYDSFEQVAEQFFVRFAVDTHFFMEIAKLRAFRVLWNALVSAYGLENNRVPVFTETSLRTYSSLDPYVNLLRAGNEAFSAVLGGTDVLMVHPHNIVTGVDSKSARYARNIQHVIREETHVQAVLDPAGGSYFIESLTKEMVEKAWELFLEIEQAGGYSSYVSSDEFKAKLSSLHEKRIEDLATGKHVLVGTNSYADLSEELHESVLDDNNRLSVVYENFRAKFAESQPKTYVFGFGQLKEYKPISDFAVNFLASGGIKAESSPGFQSIDEFKEWVKTNDFDYGIICAPKDRVNEIVEGLANIDLDGKIIDVAGNYQEELDSSWKQFGVEGLLYKGQNQIEKFISIEKFWEEVNSVEKA